MDAACNRNNEKGGDGDSAVLSARSVIMRGSSMKLGAELGMRW
jgi:hypothetical protein